MGQLERQKLKKRYAKNALKRAMEKGEFNGLARLSERWHAVYDVVEVQRAELIDFLRRNEGNHRAIQVLNLREKKLGVLGNDWRDSAGCTKAQAIVVKQCLVNKSGLVEESPEEVLIEFAAVKRGAFIHDVPQIYVQ